MATINASISVNSDIMSYPVRINKSMTMKKAGSCHGLDETTGMRTKKFAAESTPTAAVIVEHDELTDDKAHKVYIRNTSTGASDYILVELEGNVIIGRLYPGDWMFIPYGGTLDVQVTTVATNVSIEYGVFSQSVVS